MGRWAIRVAAVGATAGLVLAGPAGSAVAGASSGVPYTDHAAVGSIGLCNRAGRQVTSGRVAAKPFVWRAVSTAAAPSQYSKTGRTAVLYAYQPQQGLTAEEWSGAQLTASSRYSNPAHPMAAATAKDGSLKEFIEEFKPRWKGLLQLRLYLGAQGQELDTAKYAALNVRVSGNTWRAVGTATVNCRAGTATSLETIVLPGTTTTSSSKARSEARATSRSSEPRVARGSSSKGHRQ